MSVVDKITRIPIKQAFTYEDRHFTPWLCENIDVLGDAIGMELTNAEPEQSTGNFSVDIKAENERGEVVVIENQYGTSNHDHLGKLITYLTSFEAKVAIWIVESPKQEHINAIAWLNEKDNDCGFYLLKVEAIMIGNSNPAPLITLISGPSEESRQIGKIKREHSDTDKRKIAFWQCLLPLAAEHGLREFVNIQPTKDSFKGAGAGFSDLTYMFWINQAYAWIELKIHRRGEGGKEWNLEIFERLKQ